MRYVYLKKTELSRHSCKATDKGMDILGEWFTDDVSGWVESWRNWINDDREEAEDTESNATWLEKYGNEIVFGSITDLIQAKGVYKPDYDKDTISIPKENVIELLNTWEQLLKTRPKEIMITEENGVFKMFEVQ